MYCRPDAIKSSTRCVGNDLGEWTARTSPPAVLYTSDQLNVTARPNDCTCQQRNKEEAKICDDSQLQGFHRPNCLLRDPITSLELLGKHIECLVLVGDSVMEQLFNALLLVQQRAPETA